MGRCREIPIGWNVYWLRKWRRGRKLGNVDLGWSKCSLNLGFNVMDHLPNICVVCTRLQWHWIIMYGFPRIGELGNSFHKLQDSYRIGAATCPTSSSSSSDDITIVPALAEGRRSTGGGVADDELEDAIDCIPPKVSSLAFQLQSSTDDG